MNMFESAACLCMNYGVMLMVPLAIWWATWKERNRRIF